MYAWNFIYEKSKKTTENRKCIWLQWQHIFEIFFFFPEIPVFCFFFLLPQSQTNLQMLPYIFAYSLRLTAAHFMISVGSKSSFSAYGAFQLQAEKWKTANTSKSLSHRGQILKHAQHNEFLPNKTGPNYIIIPCFCQNVNTHGAPLCFLPAGQSEMQHRGSTLLVGPLFAALTRIQLYMDPSQLLLLGNENLRPTQRETEAVGKARWRSTSLMPPRLTPQPPLTALCSATSAWAGTEWQGLWRRWHQSAAKQSAIQWAMCAFGSGGVSLRLPGEDLS